MSNALKSMPHGTDNKKFLVKLLICDVWTDKIYIEGNVPVQAKFHTENLPQSQKTMISETMFLNLNPKPISIPQHNII